MMRIINIELEGFGTKPHNYDDWVDVFISYAEHEDGTPLTEEELDNIDSDIVYEEIINQLY